MNQQNTTTNSNDATNASQQEQLLECLEKLDLILAQQTQLKNIIVSQVSIISGNASSAASDTRGNENGNASASV